MHLQDTIKTANKSVEIVEKLQHLGTTVKQIKTVFTRS